MVNIFAKISGIFLALPLGENCTSDVECELGVEYSECSQGKCSCKPEFYRIDQLCRPGKSFMGTCKTILNCRIKFSWS